MNYVETNRDAWNEVYDKHQVNWIKNPIENALEKKFAYINPDMVHEFENIGLENKNVTQFCCNNGRELLSIVKAGAKSGTGFDVSDKFIEDANRYARSTGIKCDFVQSNILEIDEKYKNEFDIVFCTIGTLCWFKDLNEFFEKVSFVLKPNGYFLINDNHPFTNCFAMERESDYNEKTPDKIIYSYFKNDEWIDNSGLDYYGNVKYDSKTFISYSHTISDIVSGMTKAGINVNKFLEFNYTLDAFKSLDKGKLPLSMIICGKKGRED